MKNLLHFVLSVFVIGSFLGCSGDVVKTPDEFLKQENVLPWLPLLSEIFEIDDKERVFFTRNNGYSICYFDIQEQKIDTLIYEMPARVAKMCYNHNDGTIWVQSDETHFALWNTKTQTQIDCPPIKYKGEKILWMCGTNDPFFACGNRLFTGLIPEEAFADYNFDYAGFREKSSLIAEWDISDVNNIKCVKIFGKRPSDQPKDMFVDDYYYTAFNVEDSVIVAATELSQSVVVMNFKGEKLKEKKLSSVFYVPPEKRDFSQNHSATEIINYWNSNMLFRGLYYDKYRKLYYRLLDLSGEKSENTFTKKEADWVLIVADSKLRKKYEVRFDSNKYSWGSVLIGKQGVYVRKKKDKTFDLFVFD